MRKNNKKGFTLAELLIVVAIIAVLVAVAIPVFTTQLEKAREATDVSNMRAAYAIAATDVLTRDYKNYTASVDDSGYGTYTGYYNVATSSMQTDTYACIKAQVTGLQSGTIDWPQNATFTYSGSPSTTNGIKVVITVAATGTTIAVSDAA